MLTKLRKIRVEEFTSPSVITMDKNSSIDDVYKKMQENQLRHVLIVDGKDVVGIISDRDIRASGSFEKISSMEAKELMVKELFIVNPDTPLHEVAFTMSEKKIGSAIVLDKSQEFLGIFTATDALNALVEILRGDI